MIEGEKDTSNLYWFLSQNESTSSSLALPRDFTIISQDYKCSNTLARHFSNAQVTQNKRLLKLTKIIRMNFITHLIYYQRYLHKDNERQINLEC
jgi:hypothetical protein